jgi:NADH-quinone oxidoreductase subunit N
LSIFDLINESFLQINILFKSFDNIFLNFNNFNIFFQLSVFSSTFFLILLSKSYYKLNIIKNYEYDFLLSFSLISLIILASSNDFIMVYLAIELQSLSFYVLATFNRNSEFCNEAGIKYFVLGSFASGLLLFGFSLIYLSLGTINFEEINIIIKSKNSIDLTFIGILFVSFAFLFKLGSVPFHFWLCDVYEASLTTTTAFFSVVPKIVLFGLTLKFFYLTFINYNSL